MSGSWPRSAGSRRAGSVISWPRQDVSSDTATLSSRWSTRARARPRLCRPRLALRRVRQQLHGQGHPTHLLKQVGELRPVEP